MEEAAVPFVSIEHVGSTSVPGLAAKPVIDVDVVVGPSEVDAASSVLVSLGLSLVASSESRNAGHFGSLTGSPDQHVCDRRWLLALRNHLAVRDTLRADADLRTEYGDVKKRVAAMATDIYEYGAGKNATVQHILARSGLSDEERPLINGNQVPATERKR